MANQRTDMSFPRFETTLGEFLANRRQLTGWHGHFNFTLVSEVESSRENLCQFR